MNKPLVFNYKKYEELRNAYKELIEENNSLVAENKRLRYKLANLEIRCRIKNADK